MFPIFFSSVFFMFFFKKNVFFQNPFTLPQKIRFQNCSIKKCTSKIFLKLSLQSCSFKKINFKKYIFKIICKIFHPKYIFLKLLSQKIHFQKIITLIALIYSLLESSESSESSGELSKSQTIYLITFFLIYLHSFRNT